MANSVTAIADAITAGFKLLHEYKKDRHVRRLRRAVDYAEKYIMGTATDDKKLNKYKDKFFKYNQG